MFGSTSEGQDYEDDHFGTCDRIPCYAERLQRRVAKPTEPLCSANTMYGWVAEDGWLLTLTRSVEHDHAYSSKVSC